MRKAAYYLCPKYPHPMRPALLRHQNRTHIYLHICICANFNFKGLLLYSVNAAVCSAEWVCALEQPLSLTNPHRTRITASREWGSLLIPSCFCCCTYFYTLVLVFAPLVLTVHTLTMNACFEDPCLEDGLGCLLIHLLVLSFFPGRTFLCIISFLLFSSYFPPC